MIFRKIWATALLSVALVMSDVSLGAEELARPTTLTGMGSRVPSLMGYCSYVIYLDSLAML